jgi:hypothetical protein
MNTKREIVHWEKNSENEILCQSEDCLIQRQTRRLG